VTIALAVIISAVSIIFAVIIAFAVSIPAVFAVRLRIIGRSIVSCLLLDSRRFAADQCAKVVGDLADVVVDEILITRAVSLVGKVCPHERRHGTRDQQERIIDQSAKHSALL
jgi:hypothetical protein